MKLPEPHLLTPDTTKGWVVRHLVTRRERTTGHPTRFVTWWGGPGKRSGALGDTTAVWPTKDQCLAALRQWFGTVPAASRQGFTPQQVEAARAEFVEVRYCSAREAAR